MERTHTVCRQHAHWNPYRAVQYSALRGVFGSVDFSFFFGGGVCFLPHPTLSLSVFIPRSTHSKHLSKKTASLENQHRMDLPSYFLYKTRCFYAN